MKVTLELIASSGVPGTTMSRIAERAGVQKPTLYAYFSSRRELLLAALDDVFESIFDIHRSATHPNALERLREIGRRHTHLMVTQQTPYVFSLVEIIAAPPEEGLRDVVGQKQMAAARDLADIVEEGKRQGSIAKDVDSEQVGWMIAGWAWTEGISHLIGASAFWHAKRSAGMLDLLLDGISASDRASKDMSPTRGG